MSAIDPKRTFAAAQKSRTRWQLRRAVRALKQTFAELKVSQHRLYEQQKNARNCSTTYIGMQAHTHCN
jgi:hypothetical protein